MHCLYTKDNVIDTHTGYPTLDGLVNFYSDGVHEHGFFMTTLRAVDFCLKSASIKYHINRHVKPGEYLVSQANSGQERIQLFFY